MASPNWHWKSKIVTPWAKEWFQTELKVSVQGEDGTQVSVTDVQFIDGDAEIGQRKSKLIAIYDVHLKLTWSGQDKDGSEVTGTIDIPEVSHEITLDKLHDYVYNWEMTSDSSKTAAEVYDLARKQLPPALEAKFTEFPTALMSTHGKDITVSASPSQQPSRSGTPVATTTPAKPSEATRPKPTEKARNTTSISTDASFMASADDLYSILTDEKRIPQWSRNAAVSHPTPGSAYSLFGGGVTGSYTAVSPPTAFVQSWALQNPSWPSGHFATLTTSLVQSTDSTKVTWSMTGIPVGLEDEINRNIQGYYIGGLKSIGYVQVSHPVLHYPQPAPRRSTPESSSSSSRPMLAILTALIVLLAAFAVPYLGR